MDNEEAGCGCCGWSVGAQVVGDKARAASDDHDALVLEIVRGSHVEEDGPLEGAAVQQASQNAEEHGQR